MAVVPTLAPEAARSLFLLAVLAAPSITTFESALVVALLAWALSRFAAVPGQEEGAAPLLLAPLAMLACWSLISALASPEPAMAARRCAGMIVWIAAPMAAMLLDEVDSRRVRALLLGLAGTLGLWGAAEGLLLWDGDPLLRVRGPFSHHLTLAGFLLVGLLQGLPRPDLAPLLGRRAAAGRLLGKVAIGLAAAGLLATLSRGAALALGVGLAILAGGGRRAGRPRALALAALAAGVLLAVTLPALAAWRSPEILEAARASSADRLALWRAGWEGIREHPFLGVGAGRTAQDIPPRLPAGYVRPGPPSHLHSAPLTLALERGVPALLGWLLFLAGAFRAGARATRGAWADEAGALAALAGALVLGLFEDNFGDSEVAFVFMVTAGRLHGAAARAGHPRDGAAGRGAGAGATRTLPA